MAIRKIGKNYYVDVSIMINGKQVRTRRKVGPYKAEAEEVYHALKNELLKWKYLEVKPKPKITFEELSRKFLEWAKVNKRSWNRDSYSIKRLSKTFGGKYLHEISPFLVEKYKRERMSEGVKPATINRELACLKTMLNKAKEWELFEGENPAKKKMLKENNERVRYLSREELTKLLQACQETKRAYYLYPFVIVALHTGMRRSEILALRWEDVDFENNIIHVRHSKNNKRRDIPMTETVKEALETLYRSRTGEYVFCRKNGVPFKELRGAFEEAVKRAGISDFRFHDLRHTFASYMVMNGADLLTVKELLGHSTLTMVMRYAHLSPDHKRAHIRSFNEEFSKLCQSEKIGCFKKGGS